MGSKSSMGKETVYKVQSYLVKFDMGNPVDVNINVYHENQTQLTRQEILDEAICYAEEVGVRLSERDLYKIETLEKE